MNRISPSASLFAALEALNALSGSGVMTLLAVDARGRLCGTLTDGDIRRALLRGTSMQARVADVMRTDFRALRSGQTDPSADYDEFCRLGLSLIPVTDADGCLVDVIDTRLVKAMLPLSAILMAGGRGERLRPLTLSIPKPLLPVGGKPIIDYNLALLRKNGITDVTVTVNYMAEQLERHFAEPVEGINVHTVRETEPMGTIGAASLIGGHRPDGHTLVMNSDLLTSFALRDMWTVHASGGNDVTIAAVPYNVSVPYALLDIDEEGGCVAGLREKPLMSYYANAGIYIFANHVLAKIPDHGRTDAPDLIADVIKHGGRVGYFPLSGTWVDIGTPADYRHACELVDGFKR